MSKDAFPLSAAFGEPLVRALPLPDVDAGIGVDLPTGRIGIACAGTLHVVELGPEQLLALGTALTVAARVQGAREDVALQMLAPQTRATLEALLGRRLVKPAMQRIATDEVAGHA
jgi:hypothetical protein